MYDPSFNSRPNYIDTGDDIRYDDIKFYANLTTINNIVNKNTQTRYVDESNGNEYRWNGSSLVLMNSGSGSVSAITSDANLQITGTVSNPIISYSTLAKQRSGPNIPFLFNATSSIPTADGQIYYNSATEKLYLGYKPINNNELYQTNYKLLVEKIRCGKFPFKLFVMQNNTDPNSAIFYSFIIGSRSGNPAYAYELNVIGTGIENVSNIFAFPTSGLYGVYLENYSVENIYGSANQITVNTDNIYKNVFLSLPSNINVGSVTLSGPVDSNSKAATKLYVDTAFNGVSTLISNQEMQNHADVEPTLKTGITAGDALVWNGTLFDKANIYSELDITNSLLFNGTFNSNANDSSTYALTGTITGATQTTGKLGNCYSFSGTNQYIDYGDAAHLEFTVNDNFSVSFWMRTTASDANERNILGKGLGDNGEGWTIRMQGNLNEIRFLMCSNSSTRNMELRWVCPNLNNDTWHYITLVKKVGYQASTADLYYDGVINNNKTQQTDTLLSSDDVRALTTNFNVGGRNNGEGNDYNGLLDQVSIYSFDLKKSNIESLYNSGTGTESFIVRTITGHNHQIADIINLQSSLNTLTNNITTLTTNKIDTLTNTDTFISITGTGATRTLNMAGTLSTVRGGTGLTTPFVVGDILYADTTTTLARRAGIATGNALISGGVGVAPTYGKIGLTTHVSGILPVSAGGTNIGSYTVGDLIQASATGTLARLAAVATGNVLISGGIGVISSWGKVGLTTHVSGTLPLANGGTNATDATTARTNLGVYSIPQVDALMNKNMLTDCSVQILNATSAYPSVTADTLSYTGTGSLDVVFTINANLWERALYLPLPLKKLIVRETTPEELFFAVRLSGANWTGTGTLANILVGFTNEATLETASNWMTTELISGYTGVWTVGPGTKEKIIRGRFLSSGMEWVYGAANAGTRTGAVTNADGISGDVLVCYLDRTMTFTLELRRLGSYGTVSAKGTIAHPDGPLAKHNFNQSPIVPVVSVFSQFTTTGITILSKRDTDTLGITTTNGINIFA